MRAAIVTLTCLLSVAAAARAETGADHVRIDVSADTTAVRDGHPFTLAVRFLIDPGWHIYWTNPGDSGLPTRVTIDMADGFVAGAVQYPVPAVLKLPGGVTDYGYENEVVLLVPVTTPKSFGTWSPDVQFGFVAHADYLVCRENCLPGRSVAFTTLRRSDHAGPANGNLFRTAVAQLPRDLYTAATGCEYGRQSPAAGEPFEVRIHWTPEAAAEIKSPTWVPPLIPGYGVEQVRLTTEGGVTDLQYTLTKEGNDRPPARADGLLVYTRPDGRRVGIDLPMYPGDTASHHRTVDFGSVPFARGVAGDVAYNRSPR